MMRKVTVEINVDPTEYHGAKDTPLGATELVLAMLRNEADLPEKGVTVACEHVTRLMVRKRGSRAGLR